MDPFTIAIATAATGKVVELAGDPVKAGVKHFYALVRGRLKDDAELAKADQAPGGAEKAAVLEGVIRRAADADPEIRRQAEALEALVRRAMDENAEYRRELESLREAAREASARPAGPAKVVTFNANGTAEKVVQIGEVSGEANIY